MELFNSLESIKTSFENAVVTIGNFDGVHIGHRALLKETVKYAKKINGTSVVITFNPHPLKVLKENGPPVITRYDQKIELIAESGVDIVICIPFTKEFASFTAIRFLEEILIKKIAMKAIVVGEDYAFGKKRSGNIEFLKEQSEKFNFKVIIPDLIQMEGLLIGKISSTKIREIIMDGDVNLAPKLLGRFYQIRGKVVSGRNRGGRLLGFPTANIKLHDELCPKMGVYAVTIECEFGTFTGVANLGYSPTFDDHLFTIEVHILDFNNDIYGKRIRVNFVERLRDEMKFAGIEELSAQINQDIKKARKIFSER
ncbi:MAG: riboflavin biosynthesis protein RibF [Desulfobacteraceae bacterium 4572_19]|nr:MAG: riboflavin biosynthesis protein RibF [Desulfobacteraceae bacterium 4572_19]